MPPYDPNALDLEFLEEDLRREREAYDALVDNNGRPCYPIELGFEVFNNPGQYENLFSYWRGEPGVHYLIFSAQLERWRMFRQFQQKNRRYFVFHRRFPGFQQKVLERRRRHELDGDVQLLEDRDKQGKLDDWMEYQDYELLTYERFEQDLKETQARLVSRREALAEAGISAFEGIQELEFANYYSLAIECGREEAKAKKKMKSAELKLRLAEKRLKAAESDDLGERVERVTWIGLFLKEVESAQMRLDELQRLAEDAKCELEPFDRWFQARRMEWAEFSEEDKRLVRLEVESAEFQDRNKKHDELGKKSDKAGFARYMAKENVEFAEEVYNAARLDNFEEAVERAVLIKMVQEEVRSAQTQFEEKKESTEKIEIKGKVISGLSSISCIKGKMKRHNVLLEWIEQQRREIASGPADTEREGGQGRSKRASSRALRNHSVNEASRLNKTPKTNNRKRKQSTARSILSPVDPAKVSKAPSKRRSPHQKTSVSCDASQTVEKTTIDSSAPQSRSKQVFKAQNATPASLRATHSSKVSKPGAKRPTRLRRDGTKLTSTTDTHGLTRKDNWSLSSISSTDRKAFTNASLRRSTRISKQPEIFRPGYA